MIYKPQICGIFMATDVESFNVYFSTISVYISDFVDNFKLLKFQRYLQNNKRGRQDIKTNWQAHSIFINFIFKTVFWSRKVQAERILWTPGFLQVFFFSFFPISIYLDHKVKFFLGQVSYCHHFSSVVRPSTFHILIFSSETTGPIATKLWWNGLWMTPFQNCIRWSRLPTKMAAKLKIEKRGDEILILHCCFSIGQNELKF